MPNPMPIRTRLTTGVRRAALALAGIALVAASGLQAQEGEERSPQEVMAELQQVNQELAPIQQQAMQDPELQQQGIEVQEMIVSAMTEVDPEAETKMERLNVIQGEIRTAREEGSQQEVQGLMSEQQELQGALQQAQAEAMQAEEVAQAVQEFRAQLVARMKEVDPKAEELLQRQAELQEELQAATSS